MRVSQERLPTSRHADGTGRRYILVLLVFAVALGGHQREGMWTLAPMITSELSLGFSDLGKMLSTFALA